MRRGIAPLVVVAALAHASSAQRNPGADALKGALQAWARSDNATAMRLFEKARQLEPALGKIACPKQGAILYEQKRFADAVKLLRDCPEPEDLPVREILGQCLYKTGNTDEAVKMLEGVLDDNPRAYAAELQLAMHFEKSDAKKAIPLFEGYLRDGPHLKDFDWQIRQRLGYLDLRDSRWSAARGEFSTVMTSRPGELLSKMGLGAAYVGENDWAHAVEILEPLLVEAEKQPSISYNLAKAYAGVGRREDAKRVIALYRRLKPDDARAQKFEAELSVTAP
jgi:tetratricopeptide (TPR) repeat protein